MSVTIFRILDPNPKTKISNAKIIKSSRFKVGLENPAITATENQEPAPLNDEWILEACENDGPPIVESKYTDHAL